MDTQRLREAVEEEFTTTGMATPPWPDPRPGGTAPSEGEYSRCLAPGKYRILRARAEAWARALNGLRLATREEFENSSAAWRDESDVPLESTFRLRPVRADATPLSMVFRSLDGVPDAVVVIGAGEPAVQVFTLPDCGCDACDSGSEDLLESFDEHVLAVVRGDFVHVTTRKGTVAATGSGWSASGMTGRRKIETVLNEARAGRSPHRVVYGAPWA